MRSPKPNSLEAAILALLEQDPGLTDLGIVERTGKSRSRVRVLLDELADAGVLTWRRDPTARRYVKGPAPRGWFIERSGR